MLLPKNFPTYPGNIPQTLNQQFMIRNSCIICRIKVRCKLAALVSELGFPSRENHGFNGRENDPPEKTKNVQQMVLLLLHKKLNTWKLKIKFVEKGDSELENPIIFPASIGKNSERISWGFQYYVPFTLLQGLSSHSTTAKGTTLPHGCSKRWGPGDFTLRLSWWIRRGPPLTNAIFSLKKINKR